MAISTPKSKEEELLTALAEWDYDKVMSEFTSHRLLSYAEFVKDLDLQNLYKAFIYLYSRDIEKVYEFLDKLVPALNHPWFLRNCKFITHRIAHISFIPILYSSCWNYIAELDDVNKEDLIENFVFFFFLSGRIEEAEKLFSDSLYDEKFIEIFANLKSSNSIQETIYKIQDFKDFKEKYNLSNIDLVKFSELLKSLIIKHNLNVKIIDYSLINDELLITLKVDKDIQYIHKINDDFFDFIYDANLVDLQESLSLHFSPATQGE